MNSSQHSTAAESYSALCTLPNQSAAQQLAKALEAIEPPPIGLGVFAIEDNSGRCEVGAYYNTRPDDIALALLAAVHGAKPFAISVIPPTDWVALVRRELHPIQAGRFFIYGRHDAKHIPKNTVPLLIEAAMAFGTGHHASTQGCLLALEDLIQSDFIPRRVLDLGCGTAVLAMAAAKIWDGTIIASDSDETACATARANLDCNHLAGRVAVVNCAGFDDAKIATQAPFDLIFANILMRPLLDLLPAMAQHCARNGVLILSGILHTQAKAVIRAYQSYGFVLQDQRALQEWHSLRFIFKGA